MEIKNINEYTDLISEFLTLANKLSSIQNKLSELNYIYSYGNRERAKAILIAEAQKDYGKERVIDCFGDIFVINEDETEETIYYSRYERRERTYTGRRLLFNGKLSKEKYEIQEVLMETPDGDYDYTDYEIKVLEGEK